MIKIIKPTTVPKKLREDGRKEDDQNRKDYDADPCSYINFKILNSIYGHPTVKKVLKEAQKNKCCFCEKDQSDEYGAVEHFRPKKGYKSTKKETLKRPGYFWLGYAWSNLYFVCNACNSAGNKGNLFPLLDESKRAKPYHDDESEETPLLLDPGGASDPMDHIAFQNELPVGKTIFGRTTIKVCGLDREALNNKRKELISNIELRLFVLSNKRDYDMTKVEEARNFIKNSTKANAGFSATASDFLKKFNIQQSPNYSGRHQRV